MRQIKKILRLKGAVGLSDRLVGEAIGVSRSSVQECLRRARIEQVQWPQCQHLDGQQLLLLLYKARGVGATKPVTVVPLPDFAVVDQELSRKGMQYTAYCRAYRKWLAQSTRVFRQTVIPLKKQCDGFKFSGGITVAFCRIENF
jgi:hypothetical protein